jgi:hypothetical protein
MVKPKSESRLLVLLFRNGNKKKKVIIKPIKMQVVDFFKSNKDVNKKK